jgi:hypothetical protein
MTLDEGDRGSLSRPPLATHAPIGGQEDHGCQGDPRLIPNEFFLQRQLIQAHSFLARAIAVGELSPHKIRKPDLPSAWSPDQEAQVMGMYEHNRVVLPIGLC